MVDGGLVGCEDVVALGGLGLVILLLIRVASRLVKLLGFQLCCLCHVVEAAGAVDIICYTLFPQLCSTTRVATVSDLAA